jgi:RNA polymerase sigma-70 factor (ECF subfamily)
VNNVTVRLHRARQALKIRLEQMCRSCVVHGFLDCRCDKHVHPRPSRFSGGPSDGDWGEGTDGPEVLDRPQ